jgi:hypothetical protein
MSRRVPNNTKGKHVKVEVMVTSCHVCKAHGKTCKIVESHNFRDTRGKVCCPTILENVCSKCGQKGHFQSRCEVSTGFKKFKLPSMRMTDWKEKPNVGTSPTNAFAALTEESDSEEAIKDDPPPANVTVRKPVAKKSWADYDDSDDEW